MGPPDFVDRGLIPRSNLQHSLPRQFLKIGIYIILFLLENYTS